MIVGIGVDIVDVRRIRRSLERYGERLARRVLSADEFAEYQQSRARAHYLARCFAAKEAFSKALGTGFRNGLSLRHIAIRHDELGKPDIVCHGRAAEIIQARGNLRSHLSLADERDYALAYVVLENSGQ